MKDIQYQTRQEVIKKSDKYSVTKKFGDILAKDGGESGRTIDEMLGEFDILIENFKRKSIFYQV